MQARLLHAASVLVKPGGLLVYSTCSIEAQENEEQANAFLASHSHFSADRVPSSLPAIVVTPGGHLAVWPPLHSTDGAFAARFRHV